MDGEDTRFSGWVLLEHGKIAAMGEGKAPACADDSEVYPVSFHLLPVDCSLPLGDIDTVDDYTVAEPVVVLICLSCIRRIA